MKLGKENKLVFLMGDWNLNLINHHCHKAKSDFLDLLYSRMFFPPITCPTRITANKASSIDNIFANDPLCPSINGLFFFFNNLKVFIVKYNIYIKKKNRPDKYNMNYLIFKQ